MADTAIQVLVSPFIGTLFNNLTSLIQSEFSLIMGFNKDMKKLSNILSTIQDVLEDAEVKQITHKPIRNWLRKLKETTYDAEDVLDECATEALRTTHDDDERENNRNIQVITHSILSNFDLKRIMFRRSIGKKIKQLREKFDEIAEERFKFHLNLNVITMKDSESKRETSSFIVDSSQVYGRDKEKDYIVNLLLNNDVDEDGIKVCPILGMGGLGKTTFAQMVYNDERVVHHFQVRCWVCVSEQFELKTILKAIVESLGGKAPDLENLDPLQRRLEELSGGKKFLLILDDVWNEDQAKWDKLKSCLNFGGRGSSVIVTTRLETVASSIMNTTLPSMCFRLNALSEENCWSLFKSRAFGAGLNEERHQNQLEGIGREIVKRCKGVPLAAKALGGLLRFKREEKEWLYVRDSEIWDLPQDTEDAILPALRLSYSHLSSHLKPCFAYCSIFPKDYEMKKEELIHLWMANGFIPHKRSMELEDVGNEIFNDLMWRSFFQEAKKDEDGNITGCKMHDLVHDLACSIMANERCSITEHEITKSFPTSDTRHLSLIYLGHSVPSSTILDESFLPASKSSLHTLLQIQLLFPDPDWKTPIPQLPVSNLKYLRVLGFHWTNMTSLPKSIGRLKHLRYLNLSSSKIKSLPDFICNLRNLQTLKLSGCHGLQKLPRNMRKMSNLRHLDIKWCSMLTGMPVGIGKLISLQTLCRFIVCPPESGCGGIEELQRLDHLRGELKIEGLEHVRNPTGTKTANLIMKQNLVSLRLVWANWSGDSESTDLSEQEDEAAMVLIEGLQPHPNNKELHIKNFKGVKFPRWMWSFSCLPNLTRISLVGCRRCEHLPPLGQLPLLKFLEVTEMVSVEYIGDEFYYGEESNAVRRGGSFQSLEELKFSRMPNLKEWRSCSSTSSSKGENEREEEQVLVFPWIDRLSIEFCPMLRECPPLPYTLLHLKLNGCKEMILVSPLERLNTLQYIQIGHCPALKSLPKINSICLRDLRIQFCNGLTSLSEGLQHLTSLGSLSIQFCPLLELSENDFIHLNALQNLTIENLPKMTSLPAVGSEHKTSKLGTLQLGECPGLTSLPGWICHLTSLQSMTIKNCKNLTFLPEGLQNLTSLRTLRIIDCHLDLHERCKEEVGDDWHKIAHIPFFFNQNSIPIYDCQLP